MRSARFSLALEGEGVVLRGEGSGHGVCLCQRGTVRRSLRGEGEDRILAHYFPRARLP